MRARTLADLSAPLMALRLLATEFPDLPALALDISTIYPDRLTMSVHDDHGAFEAWREALNIAPESVVHDVQGGGRTRVLSVRTDFAGAVVELVGYSQVPAVEPVSSGAGVLS
ncbi:hypothetical protein [Streptomyces sp. NPDC018711]|uniref:hypothetical protein n=1 Tax=Streptomyces sp. NPDC018711 TaxID=3365052 RepID=UPI00379C03C8